MVEIFNAREKHRKRDTLWVSRFFQRRLFVCQCVSVFVCMFVRTITSERLSNNRRYDCDCDCVAYGGDGLRRWENQRMLSSCQCVCQCVCLFVRTIPSERLNVGQSTFAVRYTVQKSRPSSKVKVKGKATRDKKKKNC